MKATKIAIVAPTTLTLHISIIFSSFSKILVDCCEHKTQQSICWGAGWIRRRQHRHRIDFRFCWKNEENKILLLRQHNFKPSFLNCFDIGGIVVTLIVLVIHGTCNWIILSLLSSSMLNQTSIATAATADPTKPPLQPNSSFFAGTPASNTAQHCHYQSGCYQHCGLDFCPKNNII